MPYVCLANSTNQDRDRKTIANFNRSRPQAERISMEDLRGQTVTTNLKRFLKFLGCEIAVGLPMPALMKRTEGAAATWMDLRTSNRSGENLAALNPAPDPDSDQKRLFCWTQASGPECMYFSAKAYKNLTNKGKRLLWLQKNGLAIGDVVHGDVRFTPICTTRRDAVAMKQNEAAHVADGERGPIGISWLQFLTSVTPVNKLGNTELVELPPTATIEDWRASGLKVLVHDGVKQVALQIYDRREYLISFLQESVQEEPNALRLTRFKGNLEQELEMLKLAEETQHWGFFAKLHNRTPEIKMPFADGTLATIACFDEESLLKHSGEGTFTENLGIPLIGRHALLEQASADKKLGFYLRPVVGTSISQEGLYGRRIFGHDAGEDHCHVYSQLLPAYRISGEPDEDDEENDLGLSWLQQIQPPEAWAPWRIEQGVVPASDFSAIATALQVVAHCTDLPELPVKIENNVDLQAWLNFEFRDLQDEVLETVRAVLAEP